MLLCGRWHNCESGFIERQGRRDTFQGDLAIVLLSLDTDPMTAKTPRDCARRASTEKRIKHDIARLGAGQPYAVEQCLWLLRRMRLDAIAFQPLLPAANRQYPVGAHLQQIGRASCRERVFKYR